MTDDPRTDRESLVRALVDAGQRVKGSSCTCPWHDDENPSASILQGAEGRYRVYCQRCERYGDYYDVVSSMTGRDEFKSAKASNPTRDTKRATKSPESTVEHAPEPPSVPTTGELDGKQAVKAYAERTGQVQAWHKYQDQNRTVLIVARILPHDGSKKQFRQFTPHQDGTYSPRNLLADGSIPLYRINEAAASDMVLVVEGEKACDAVADLGIPCVTSAMGAGKAKQSDWSPLAGKTVILWPDNDTDDAKGINIGRRHMQQVADILLPMGCTVHTLDPHTLGLPLKGDAFDYVDAHGGEAERGVRELMSGACRDTFLDYLNLAIEGKACNVPWPWPVLTDVTRALIPGSVTFVVGNAGATKSFMMLEATQFWLSKGVSVAICELEENADFWKQRVLAQLSGCSNANNNDWIQINPQPIREMYALHTEELNAFGKALHCAPTEGYTLSKLADWVEVQAKRGVRVIVADPITACIPETDKPWNEAQRFILRVKSAVSASGSSLVLTTHGRKGHAQTKGPPDLDSLAGGAAYARFASNVIWLEPLAESKMVTVLMATGEAIQARINRRIRILKSRSGSGTGRCVGMFFDGGTLRTEERGLVTKETTSDDTPSTEPRSDRGAKLKAQPSEAENAFGV